MAKATTIKVKLVSSADTGFYYVTKKNSRTMTDKIVKKKYDPVAKKHVEIRALGTWFSGASARAPFRFQGRLNLRWPAGRGVIEEATHTVPDRPNPTGVRRCGGPEHSVGLSIAYGAILVRARNPPAPSPATLSP